MNTEPQNQTELFAQLQKLLQSAQPLSPAAPMMGPPGGPFPAVPFAPVPQFGAVQPVGLLVPVQIPTQSGNIGVYLQLPPSALANPQAAIAALQQAGWQLRVYGGGNDSGNRWNGRRSWRPKW